MAAKTISLIYESPDFIAVNKPAGILTHPIKNLKSKAKSEKTLVNWALEKYPEIKNVGDDKEMRPGIVHRLDRDTSGVILICRNQEFFEYLKNLFSPYGESPEGKQGSQIKKTYLALVWGRLEPKIGEIKTPIGIKTGTIKRTIWQKKAKDFKEAETRYRVIKYLKYSTSLAIASQVLWFSLVELTPKTGRTHQLRIHLASINHPIVGDKIYGFKKMENFYLSADRPFELNRHFLHAASLEFSPRIGQRLKLEAELPEDLKRIIDNLEIDNLD